MAFQKRKRVDNVTPFKFEKKGDSLEGYYVKSDSITIDGKDVKRHLFQTADGLLGVLGQFDLGRQLAEETPGVMVRATFSGIQKLKGGKTLKIFELAVDSDDVLSESDTETASTAAEGEDADDADDGEDMDETEIGEEEAPADEVPPARAKPPVQAAKAPDAARKAQVQALLNKGRSKSA